MMTFFKRFLKDQDGAVTVDWVVLTAAVVGMTLVGFTTLKNNTETVASNTSDTVLSKSNEFLGIGGGTGG